MKHCKKTVPAEYVKAAEFDQLLGDTIQGLDESATEQLLADVLAVGSDSVLGIGAVAVGDGLRFN